MARIEVVKTIGATASRICRIGLDAKFSKHSEGISEEASCSIDVVGIRRRASQIVRDSLECTLACVAAFLRRLHTRVQTARSSTKDVSAPNASTAFKVSAILDVRVDVKAVCSHQHSRSGYNRELHYI